MFNALQMLETERLILREFVQEDLDEYAARIFADADVMRYLPRRDEKPRDRAERTINFFNDHHAEYGFGPWAVIENKSGELMGHCGLSYIAEVDETEVMYALAKKFWGKGFATEAAQASVDFGFREIRLDRIIALAMHDNIASRRVMEHCGMHHEKETHLFGLDLVYYALNRAEYEELLK
jgi:[ribosomal protein S5]-alanine N-acetyltransferase